MMQKIGCLLRLFPLAPLFFLAPACSSNSTSGTIPVVFTKTMEKNPTSTHSPTPTATFTAVVRSTPSEMSTSPQSVLDAVTLPYGAQKNAVDGDDFTTNRYERPFQMDGMVYLPDVDLVQVDLQKDSAWVYLTFTIAGRRADGIGQTMYGAEFDTDLDGRNEILIWGASPPDGDWTTDGVEIWADTNNDVGGEKPQIAETGLSPGDGYDIKIFADGEGELPDFAWIRQLSSGVKVQLAFKPYAIDFADKFLWNGFADAGLRSPEIFDYNDHMTKEEAGSPLRAEKGFYPLQALDALDNTCRNAFNFFPEGGEPGLCEYPGIITGVVFLDYFGPSHASTNSNGRHEEYESGVQMGEVKLGMGACPVLESKTMVVDPNGQYSFKRLAIGTYCVVYHNPYLGPSLWMTTPDKATVHIGPDFYKVVNFGIDWYH